jgi:Ca-activated chloride channel family protein
MLGGPLDPARRVAAALVESLGSDDLLVLIVFGDEARRWQQGAMSATAQNRAAAHAWLQALRASGGTDMTAGILEALAALRPDAQRQVVLVTDGQIGFESEVLSQICARLPGSSRLHTVGVGSAVNRALTGPAARAGGGVEVVIGLGEDPERASARVLRRTARPIVTELSVGGSALVQLAAATPADLFAGAPALLPVQLRAEGGELLVRGRTATGVWEERIAVAPIAAGEGQPGLVALWARERVADRELRLATGGDRASLDAEIEGLGIGFQIATRLTSFVAISDAIDVDPAAPSRSEVMPHMLPHGMSAAGLGLRGAAPMQAQEPAPSIAGSFAHLTKKEAIHEISASLPPRREPATRGAPPPEPSPPPSPPAKQKAPDSTRREGLLSRVRRLVRGPRKLRGKLRGLGGINLAIEILLDGPLDWHPPADAWLRLGDGRLVLAPMIAPASTRAGQYDAGQLVRVVVQLINVDSDPIEAQLTLPDGSELIIELESEVR